MAASPSAFSIRAVASSMPSCGNEAGSAPKVHGFTIEWGSQQNQTPFHPTFSEMKKIIDEVTAGLLEFCLRAGS